MPIRVSLKDVVIRTFWGNPFYRRVLQPFDRYVIDPQPSASFDPDDVPLNKVCRTADAANLLWRRGYDDLGFPATPSVFHRKIWEFNQTLYGLRKLRRLAPGASALGIGCGHEELMYFLANRICRVVATDLYEGSYLGGESDADVLEHPAKYAPFKYRENHLEVQRMDGLALSFAAGAFDFVFCLSSIEHFGRLEDKLQAMREMHRVLKPGGVAVVTTEVVLNRLGRGSQYFQRETLAAMIREAGFALEGPLDLRVESEHAGRPLALPMDTFVSPHVVLRNFHTIYTSVSLFLIKPPDTDEARNAIVGDEVASPTRPYRYAAEVVLDGAVPQVTPGESFAVTLMVRNAGDVEWFADPSRSHMVRIGAWFGARDGRNLTGEPPRFVLPHHVKPGQLVRVKIHLVAPEGAEQLHVGLVKELCFWFRDKGGVDFVLPLSAP